MAMHGIMEVLLLLSLFSSGNNPIALSSYPIAPENPVIYRVAPDNPLAYYAWSGRKTAENTPAGEASSADAPPSWKKLVEDKEFEAFATKLYAGIFELIRVESKGYSAPKTEEGRLAEQREEEIQVLVEYLLAQCLVSPGSLSIEEFAPEQQNVRGALVVCVGKEGPAFLPKMRRFTALVSPDPAAPLIREDGWYVIDPKMSRGVPETAPTPKFYWDVRGPYFVITLAPSSKMANAIVRRSSRKELPKWIQIGFDKTKVENRNSLCYLNWGRIMESLPPMATPFITGFQSMAGMGWKNPLRPTSACIVSTGLEDGKCVTRSWSLYSQKPQPLAKTPTVEIPEPVTLADLADVPADADIALVSKVNISQVVADWEFPYQNLQQITQQFARPFGPIQEARKIDEEDQKKQEQFLALIHKTLGESFGDRVTVFADTQKLAVDATLLIEVKSPAAAESLRDFSEKVVTYLNESFSSNLVVTKFDCLGKTVYSLASRENRRGDHPFSLNWAVTDKNLVVGPFPQTVKAYLRCTEENKKNNVLLTNKQILLWLKSETPPTSVSYVSPTYAQTVGYSFGPTLLSFMAGEILRKKGTSIIRADLAPSLKHMAERLPEGAAWACFEDEKGYRTETDNGVHLTMLPVSTTGLMAYFLLAVSM